MNVITGTWHSLVRRRLWPVALLLIAALVIVPMKLAKAPEPAVAAPASAVTGAQKTAADDVTAQPVVALATFSEPAQRRRVLGAQKDPFEPAPLPKVKKSKAKPEATATATATATPDSASGGGGSGGGTETPAPTATPAPTYPLYSLQVRFGKTTEGTELDARTLPRLTALPSADAPVLVYLGLEDGGEVAVFMLSGEVSAQGDGKCDPEPESCETLRLRVGETEFLDVTGTGDPETDAQYQLDLVKIHITTTDSAGTAKAARAKVSAAGAELVSERAVKQPLRYVYDSETGTLDRLDAKAFKALKAQSLRTTG